MKNFFLICCFFVLSIYIASAQKNHNQNYQVFNSSVVKKIKSLSLSEKIAQLFAVTLSENLTKQKLIIELQHALKADVGTIIVENRSLADLVYIAHEIKSSKKIKPLLCYRINRPDFQLFKDVSFNLTESELLSQPNAYFTQKLGLILGEQLKNLSFNFLSVSPKFYNQKNIDSTELNERLTLWKDNFVKGLQLNNISTIFSDSILWTHNINILPESSFVADTQLSYQNFIFQHLITRLDSNYKTTLEISHKKVSKKPDDIDILNYQVAQILELKYLLKNNENTSNLKAPELEKKIKLQYENFQSELSPNKFSILRLKSKSLLKLYPDLNRLVVLLGDTLHDTISTVLNAQYMYQKIKIHLEKNHHLIHHVKPEQISDNPHHIYLKNLLDSAVKLNTINNNSFANFLMENVINENSDSINKLLELANLDSINSSKPLAHLDDSSKNIKNKHQNKDSVARLKNDSTKIKSVSKFTNKSFFDSINADTNSTKEDSNSSYSSSSQKFPDSNTKAINYQTPKDSLSKITSEKNIKDSKTKAINYKTPKNSLSKISSKKNIKDSLSNISSGKNIKDSNTKAINYQKLKDSLSKISSEKNIKDSNTKAINYQKQKDSLSMILSEKNIKDSNTKAINYKKLKDSLSNILSEKNIKDSNTKAINYKKQKDSLSKIASEKNIKDSIQKSIITQKLADSLKEINFIKESENQKIQIQSQLKNLAQQLDKFNSGYFIINCSESFFNSFSVKEFKLNILSLFNPDSTLILFLSDPKYLHYVDSFPNVVFVNNFQYANLADLCKLLNSEIPAASNIYFFNNHQWQVINAIDMYPNIEIKNQNAVKDTDTNYNFKNLDTLLIKGFRFKSFNDAHYIVFKDNTIIYDSYISNKGLQKNIPVQNAPIFDYENLTNIAVTTLGLIKLISDNKNKYDIYNCLELFFPDYKNFPISKIPLSNILLHRSGLGDEIEFLHYLKNKNNPNELNPNYFSYYIKPEYTQPFADNIFVRDTLKSLLFTTIISSEISNQKKFVFSQLSFYLLGKVVETMSNKPLDIFFKENYLKPLSLNYTNYLPRQYFTKSIIVPSYNDTVYRNQLIQGYSTDQLTSLNGGVSGNGGLFGTAKELGYLFIEFQNELLGQQNLNLNYYNNQVLNEFINLLPLPFNKRGLGFELSYKINNVYYPSKYISDKAFGSRTDNGSFIWLDPKNHLVFVFFTNRNCCPESKLNYNAFHSLLIDNIYQRLHLNGN